MTCVRERERENSCRQLLLFLLRSIIDLSLIKLFKYWVWVNIDEIETNESSYESHSRVCSTHYTLNTYTILQYMTIESATPPPPPVRLHYLIGIRLKYPSIPCVAVIILNISESDSTHTLERASNYLSLSLSYTTFSFFFWRRNISLTAVSVGSA